MAKLGNPFGGKSQIWITQTYHGSSNTAIDCYWKKYKPNLAVYALADGEILGRSSGSGSYCYQSVNGSDMRIWYVHTHNWKAKGTKVKRGDKICEIAPKSKNGGYPEHLHLGLTPKGKYYIMDYFDRSFSFYTKYEDIKRSWFKSNGTLDWSKFADRSYLPLFNKGDKLEILKDMNIRDDKQSDIGTAKAGAVCIVENVAYDYKGYQFYKVSFANKQCFIADTDFNKITDKEVTNLDGSKPESEVDILKEEIKRLELIIGAQREELDRLNQTVEAKDQEILKLNEVVGAAKEYCTAHNKLENECNKL